MKFGPKVLVPLMGGKVSKKHGKIPKGKNKEKDIPGYKDTAVLASETFFSVNEVEALYDLYQELSNSPTDDGLIYKEEFRRALLTNGGKPNLFVDRIFDAFDLKNKGAIGFGDFVRSMNVFHPKAPEAEKISFAFKLYDLRRKGYIEREELKEMILAILEELNVTLPDDRIEAMIDKTFMDADSKRDGRIDLDEWKEFVAKNPSLMKMMTLPYLRDITTFFPGFLCNTQVLDSDLATKLDSDLFTELDCQQPAQRASSSRDRPKLYKL